MRSRGGELKDAKKLEKIVIEFVTNDQGKLSPAALRFVSLLSLYKKVGNDKDTVALVGNEKIVKALRIKANDIGLTRRGFVSDDISVRLSDLLLSNATLNPFSTDDNPGAGTMGQDIYNNISKQSRAIRELASAVSASR